MISIKNNKNQGTGAHHQQNSNTTIETHSSPLIRKTFENKEALNTSSISSKTIDYKEKSYSDSKLLLHKEKANDEWNTVLAPVKDAFLNNSKDILKSFITESLDKEELIEGSRIQRLRSLVDTVFDSTEKNLHRTYTFRDAYLYCSIIVMTEMGSAELKSVKKEDIGFDYFFSAHEFADKFSLEIAEKNISEANKIAFTVNNTIETFCKGDLQTFGNEKDKCEELDLPAPRDLPGVNNTPWFIPVYSQTGELFTLNMSKAALRNDVPVYFMPIPMKTKNLTHEALETRYGFGFHDSAHWRQRILRLPSEYKLLTIVLDYIEQIENYEEFLVADYFLFRVWHEGLLADREDFEYTDLNSLVQDIWKNLPKNSVFLRGFIETLLETKSLTQDEHSKANEIWEKLNVKDKKPHRSTHLLSANQKMYEKFYLNFNKWLTSQRNSAYISLPDPKDFY